MRNREAYRAYNLLPAACFREGDGQKKMPMISGFRKVAASLILLGISFGYVEAAIVVYLRTIYSPVRARLHPEVPEADLFPLITPQQLAAQSPEVQRLLPIELVREAATLVMLMAAGLAVANNGRQWVAAFAVAMGTWDIFFYLFLKVLIGWPASWLTWDILFLIPAPWVSPVLAPVLVALSMVGGGLALLWVESEGAVFHTTGKHWIGLVAGALIILISFLWDTPRLVAGGTPRSFPWIVFAVGEAIGIGTFAHAYRKSLAGRIRGPE